ncbi:MAG: hypothetical protein KAJ07_00540 [Planctomycetes bacterium]|nr:hypothetical protein [Planctomycetota bacterium]
MTASRIYKVTVKKGDTPNSVHYVRASSRAQAERHVMQDYLESCVASQDDIIIACETENPIEDARKEAKVDEGTDNGTDRQD